MSDHYHLPFFNSLTVSAATKEPSNSNHDVQMPDQLPFLGDKLYLFYYENGWSMITLYQSACKTYYFVKNHIQNDFLYNCKPVQDLIVKYGVVTVFDVEENRHIIPIRGGNEDRFNNMIIGQYQAFDDYCLQNNDVKESFYLPDHLG